MTVGRNRLSREGLMLPSVGTTGAVTDGGGVVVATEMIVVVVPSVGVPLLPQTVVTAATAMTTALPARNDFTLDGYSTSSCRSVRYLTMTSGVTCGISLPGPIFASCTAERNRSVGRRRTVGLCRTRRKCGVRGVLHAYHSTSAILVSRREFGASVSAMSSIRSSFHSISSKSELSDGRASLAR